jgi:dynamin 1-like protein
MSSYYDIVRKNFMDLVPKTIMHFLVLFAKDRIESELVEQLYRDEMYDDLLRETDDVAARRKNAESLLTLLKSAVGIVNEVRDFAV